MIGRTPGSIVAVRPLKDGVIADFDITATMLKHFIRQATKSSSFGRPHIVVCIPSGVTEVERRAVEDAARQAGANHVGLNPKNEWLPAIGAGLPVGEPCGSTGRRHYGRRFDGSCGNLFGRYCNILFCSHCRR